jgi:chromosome segregation ATPase
LSPGGMIIMAEENKLAGNVENIDSLKEKLLSVSNEIDAIKNTFTKNAENLSRIQNLLSIGNLEDITGMIEKYESRFAEVEKQRIEASDGAKKYSEELEKEKERLIKLWDAYKNQEEELSTAEKKASEYEERVRAAEVEKKQIEEDLTVRINTLTEKLQQYEGNAGEFENYKQKCEEFDGIRNQLERELHDLRDASNKKDNMINDLSRQVSELSAKENYEEFKGKFEEVQAEYEKEKERLTKLYQLYEETESECKTLKSANEKWESWYNTNKDMFSRLFSGAPPDTPQPKKEIPPPEISVTPEEPIENTTKDQPETKSKKSKSKKFKIKK